MQYGTAVDIWDLIAGASRFNCVQMAPCQTGRNSTLCGKWGRQKLALKRSIALLRFAIWSRALCVAQSSTMQK